MRAAEGLDLHARAVDAHHRRHALGVAVEIGERADHLGRKADVGDSDRVAVAVTPGFLFIFQMSFDRLKRPERPMREPEVAAGLVHLELLLQVVPHPGNDQWMAIGGCDQGEAAHARAAARILWQQRRLGMRLLEILEDRERLEQRRPRLVEDQRRHYALRIDREIVVAVLLAFEQVDRYFLGLQSLERECHAHAVGRERAPESIELHHLGGTTGISEYEFCKWYKQEYDYFVVRASGLTSGGRVSAKMPAACSHCRYPTARRSYADRRCRKVQDPLCRGRPGIPGRTHPRSRRRLDRLEALSRRAQG